TDLFYAQGGNEMLFLQATHSQNILARWNVGFVYQRITSEGYFPRQTTSLYNYQITTTYHSKNKRYMLLANATWNRGVNEESGGVKSDSLFEALTGANKVVSPKLTDAQSRFKNRAAHITQYWNFGTAKYAYSDEDTLYDFASRSHIAYTFHAEDMIYGFDNAGTTDTTLLPHQYYDVGATTYDSAYYGKMSHNLAFSFFNSREKQLQDSIRTFLNGGISHTLINVAQPAFIRQFHNIIIDGTFEKQALKNYSLSFALYGAYNLSGFNSGDFKQEASIRYRLPLFDVKATEMVQFYRPDYALLLFKSNQFIWNNTFDQTSVTKLGGSITTRSLRHNATVSFNQYALPNWTYIGTDATPKQQSGTALVTTLTVSKTFQAWKFFFEHELMYQQSNTDVIRLPEYGGMIRYYFESRLFKRLKFQLGFSVFYNSAYYANDYNPASRLFYLQNNTRIGNYPVMDPFFLGEVKRASFFVKYEHVNQDWTARGFYYTPHYPITLQSLRLGVRWRFYN
ncbi:MAG: putative porin, partial [Bacteroidota bacterium]